MGNYTAAGPHATRRITRPRAQLSHSAPPHRISQPALRSAPAVLAASAAMHAAPERARNVDLHWIVKEERDRLRSGQKPATTQTDARLQFWSSLFSLIQWTVGQAPPSLRLQTSCTSYSCRHCYRDVSPAAGSRARPCRVNSRRVEGSGGGEGEKGWQRGEAAVCSADATLAPVETADGVAEGPQFPSLLCQLRQLSVPVSESLESSVAAAPARQQ